MARLWPASKGQVSYGDESTDYQEASSPTSYFGLISGDIEPPNPNAYTALATGGEGRQPHALTPDPHEFEFDVPFHVIDGNAPFEYALGSRTETAKDPDSDGSDDYTEVLFQEADVLPTATLEHAQADSGGSAVLQRRYIGCKASLSLRASVGEPVQAAMTWMGIKSDKKSSPAVASLNVPNQDPFRFWHLDNVAITRSSDGSSVKDLATCMGFDLTWDPGLEIKHHGGGRDGYVVVETNAENLYNHSLEMAIEDLDLYNEAYNDNALIDFEFQLPRPPSQSKVGGEYTDALLIRLNNCKITSAPAPNPQTGRVEGTVDIQPRGGTEIEIRDPL